MFVKHLLKIAFNRLVKWRIDTEMMTRADDINFVLEPSGLIGGYSFAVFNLHKRIVIICYFSRTV